MVMFWPNILGVFNMVNGFTAELTSHSRPILSWQRAVLILRGQTQ